MNCAICTTDIQYGGIHGAASDHVTGTCFKSIDENENSLEMVYHDSVHSTAI